MSITIPADIVTFIASSLNDINDVLSLALSCKRFTNIITTGMKTGDLWKSFVSIKGQVVINPETNITVNISSYTPDGLKEHGIKEVWKITKEDLPLFNIDLPALTANNRISVLIFTIDDDMINLVRTKSVGCLMKKWSYYLGKKHGHDINYFPSGRIESEATWKMNRLEGVSRSYHELGNPKTLTYYINGYKNGLEQYWWSSGHIKEETQWNIGERVTTKAWFDEDMNNKIREDTNWVNGQRNLYYPTGILERCATYVEGKKHGDEVAYFRSGNKESVTKWEHGKKSGPYEEYHENGNLKKKSNYLDGSEIGKSEGYNPDGSLSYSVDLSRPAVTPPVPKPQLRQAQTQNNKSRTDEVVIFSIVVLLFAACIGAVAMLISKSGDVS